MSASYAGVMKETGSYTIDELVEATDFDKRTIAYYVQEGVLPKIGRRGRLTRYPQSFANRLLAIKHLREAEETGKRPIPMTLAEIREAMDRIPDEELDALAAGALPISLIDNYTEPPDDDDLDDLRIPPPEEHRVSADEGPSETAARASRKELQLEETDEPDLFMPRRMQGAQTSDDTLSFAEDRYPYETRDRDLLGRNSHAGSGPPPDRHDEATQLAELLRDLARTTAGSGRNRGLSQTRTHAHITPGLSLSALELDDNSRPLLERVARLLRKLTTSEYR